MHILRLSDGVLRLRAQCACSLWRLGLGHVKKNRDARLPIQPSVTLCPLRSPVLSICEWGGSQAAGTAASLSKCVTGDVCVQVLGRLPSQLPYKLLETGLVSVFLFLFPDSTQAPGNERPAHSRCTGRTWRMNGWEERASWASSRAGWLGTRPARRPDAPHPRGHSQAAQNTCAKQPWVPLSSSPSGRTIRGREVGTRPPKAPTP